MAVRFPDAPDLHTLWQNILQRYVSIRPIAHRRWHHEHFQNRPPRDPLSIHSRTQAYLDDIDLFPGSYFQIAPRRGQVMDPQQRLTLEVAREALQDAGLECGSFDRQRSGTFVGASISEYNQLCGVYTRFNQASHGDFGQTAASELTTRLADRCLPIRIYTLPGNQLNMCAGVVSQFYDLGGPSLAVDAACASSLMALVQAVQYLRGLTDKAGPAPVALAGGVYLAVLPDNLLAFSRVGALAREECRPFDERAEGFILGEGAGMVVLKRLEHAVRDRDRIYAVIRGVAWNADGASSGPMTPVSEGQTRVLQLGLADSGLDPGSIDYIECHGTATPVGDPIELEALWQVMKPRAAPVRLGSIKANIGHTISAAGVAGLIRAALAVHHGMLPPQAAFSRWHPRLERYRDRFAIESQPHPWQSDERRAVVSAFGFGGSNACAVLSQAPPAAPLADPDEALLFRCSAPSPSLLRSYLVELESRLELHPLAAIAYTQTVQRETHEFLCLFTAATVPEARHRLKAACAELAHPPERLTLLEPGLVLGPRGERREVILLLPGQAEEVPLPQGRNGQSYGEQLATFELAAAARLKERGLVGQPLGHSLGALVARVLEGEQSQEELLAFLATRHQALEQTPPGGLLAVRLTRVEAEQLAPDLGLFFAGSSHSRLQLMGGESSRVQAAESILGRREIPYRVLNRRYAYHTPLVHSADPQASLPADFQPALAAALKREPAFWLELGPGEGLSQCVRAEAPGELVLSVARPGHELLALGLAHSLGHPIELGEHYPGRQVVNLPAVPLERQRYWVVDPPPEELGEVEFAVLPAPSAGPAEETVLELVARVGGFPREQITRRQSLSAHLGFDSLMLAQLHARLQASLGQAPPPEFWKCRPTVGQLLEQLGQQAPSPVQNDLSQFPEVRAMLDRIADFEERGWQVPYLHTHDCDGGPWTEVEGQRLLSFSSYNYLGLNGHPEVSQAAGRALERWGTSASASRLVSGQRPVHEELERSLADFLGVEACLTLVSGHATNVSLLACLVGPGDLVLHDSLIHDSVQQGARLSGARQLAFPHNDLEALDRLLARHRSQHRRVLVVVEGVYSMDGDLSDLSALLQLKERHGFLLMVDEAHSLGVLGATGRGLAEHWGVEPGRVDVWMGTLSKALASCGGYVAGSQDLITYLKLTAPGFVYSVGMPPASAAAALAALGILQREPERVQRLRARAAFFLDRLREVGCNTGTSQGTPVIPVLFPTLQKTVEATAGLHERGVHALPILYPAVGEESTRLRFFVTCRHSEEQLSFAANALREVLESESRRPTACETPC